MTIRVRQSGHSREEDMIRSEHWRHIAKWLRNVFVVSKYLGRSVHAPAINNGDVSFFILTDDAKSVSFKVNRGSLHRRWGDFRLRVQRIALRSVRIAVFMFIFSVLTSLLLPTALFFHHCMLTGNDLLFFPCVYRGFSRAFLTFITEKCMHTRDKIALFENVTRIYMILE